MSISSLWYSLQGFTIRNIEKGIMISLISFNLMCTYNYLQIRGGVGGWGTYWERSQIAVDCKVKRVWEIEYWEIFCCHLKQVWYLLVTFTGFLSFTQLRCSYSSWLSAQFYVLQTVSLRSSHFHGFNCLYINNFQIDIVSPFSSNFKFMQSVACETYPWIFCRHPTVLTFTLFQFVSPPSNSSA